MLQDGYIFDQNHGYSPALSASNLDDCYDYDYPAPSPNLPPTPSYRGSPYTTHSELEFDGNIVVVGDDTQDYNPTEYDAPSNHHSPLLDFMNPHVSLTPPAVDNGFDHSFDHSSPASSNGLQDQESESRSRASSVSSHSHYRPSPPPIPGFESLGFGSPHWNNSHLPADKSSPPSQKPPTPPSLAIPDASPSMNTENLHTRAPQINAPQGDGGVMNGPQLHIVPATPVSGGVPPTVPFINDPAESTFFPPTSSSTLHIDALEIFTAPTPPTWNTEAAPQNLSFDTQITSDFNNSQSNTLDPYLVHHQRARSKSDTSSRPPTWDTSLDPSPSNDRTNLNLNDVLPSASPQPQGHIPFSNDPYQSGFSNPSPQPDLLHHYSFPGRSQGGAQYLTPEFPTSIRRVRSDSGRVGGHRQSRSESGISFPPSAHSEFINRNLETGGHHFLHPPETLPSITRGHQRRSSSGSRDRGIGGLQHSAPGSARISPYPSPRTSPLLTYDSLPFIPTPQSITVSSGMGRGRPVSMPAYGASSYGIPPGGIGELGAGGNLSDTLGDKPTQGINSTSAIVSKPNVTTTATAEASERRRKTDANFACPVPGCGSTFTRHFNLKGELRHPLREMVLTYSYRSHALT